MGRTLIVNADDFGQSVGITRGIVEAHECGIVTSASLMVSWPAAAAAAAYARTRPVLSVGLHVDLGEWMYCDGTWRARYQRVDCADAGAVDAEVRAQLERCRDLLGRDPTHVDSHQHVHRLEPVRSVLARVAGELRIPLRQVTPGIRHCGDFYGQNHIGEPLPDFIGIPRLISMVRSLPIGVTELACHPGYVMDLEATYREERTLEVRTLCADAVLHAIAHEKVRLASFSDVAVT
jgi:predicted glycoside hydrolase/deacetylase ChbG (UPF0249 family)